MRQVKLLEQDSSEVYASDIFQQCQSEDVSGLHSGMVLVKNGGGTEETSLSKQLNNIGSILGISDQFGEEDSS